MDIESRERKHTMTPEEQEQHEEVLRRQRILQGQEGEEARRLLEQDMAKLTPEEQGEASRRIEEREG